MRRVRSALFKTTAINTFRENGTFRSSCPVGSQNIYVIGIGNTAQMDAIRNLVSTNATAKTRIWNGKMRVFVSNCDNKPARLTCYWCYARQNSRETSPSSSWSNGLVEQTNGASSDQLIPNYTPFESTRFCKFWKVYKVRTRWINPGQNLVYNLTHKKPVFQNDQDWSDLTNRKGTTRYLMFVYHGGVANDSTTKTTISFGDANLDFIYDIKWNYTYTEDQVQTYNNTDLLPTSFPVNESVIQMNTGAVNTGDIDA